MTTPLPEDDQSALTSPHDQPDLRDIEVHGDVLDDPEYRKLLGLDEQT